MILDISVTIQSRSASITYDARRLATVTWTASQTTEKANKQTLSGKIAYEDYGISDAGELYLFFLNASTVATKGDRIVHGSDTYEVCQPLEPYSTHYEAVVKPVVGL